MEKQSKETLTYGAATGADLQAVTKLLQEANLPLEGIEQAAFVIARDGKQVLGCAALERHGTSALLRSVAVEESVQGRGMGTALVRHALEQARAAELQRVVLLTTTAADYFSRFGFRTISRSEAPKEVQDSVEFQSACPDSATVMLLEFDDVPDTAKNS